MSDRDDDPPEHLLWAQVAEEDPAGYWAGYLLGTGGRTSNVSSRRKLGSRPSVKDGRCAKCGSDDLCSWTNDNVVICERCGQNHAWPRDGSFYYGNGRGKSPITGSRRKVGVSVDDVEAGSNEWRQVSWKRDGYDFSQRMMHRPGYHNEKGEERFTSADDGGEYWLPEGHRLDHRAEEVVQDRSRMFRDLSPEEEDEFRQWARRTTRRCRRGAAKFLASRRAGRGPDHGSRRDHEADPGAPRQAGVAPYRSPDLSPARRCRTARTRCSCPEWRTCRRTRDRNASRPGSCRPAASSRSGACSTRPGRRPNDRP